jgi:hypothetical protein
MMKRLYFLMLVVVSITACGVVRSNNVESLTSVFTATSLSSPTNTVVPPLTRTLLPTKTRAPTRVPTSTPTPTPTAIPPELFNPLLVETFTPAPATVCPDQNPSLKFDMFEQLEAYPFFESEIFLEFLNSGGTISAIIKAYDNKYGNHSLITLTDLTGDKIQEIVVSNGKSINMLGCQDGEYLFLGGLPEEGLSPIAELVEMSDINRDGLKEIVAYVGGCFNNRCPSVGVYEWNGEEFLSLIENFSSVDGCANLTVAPFEVEVKDIDGNGTKEIIMHNSGNPWPDNDFPYREETRICMWNGQSFVVFKNEFSSPYYRYQAVQDGDRATLNGDYESAFEFYQQAINDEKLEWFSLERWMHDFETYRQQYFSSAKEPTPTMSPSLTQNPDEYPVLAAYSYFRIMVLYALQNDLQDVELTYNTLQDKFPMDRPGGFFTHVASEFWLKYQPTQNLQEACDVAIAYARKSPNMLDFLGSSDHGYNSFYYTPDDICPFTQE